MRTLTVSLLLCTGSALLIPALAEADARPPNILLIYTDDVGYGDVGCYGATRIKTPNIDRLAADGLRFTDAHCTSGTCTPSRFGLLTGKYPWRKKGTGVLPGNASLIIPPGTPTVASVLRDAGYTTGAIGKWHLGLGDGDLDWNGKIAPGPLEIGFDYCFLIPATGDRVPCVYVENHRVANLDPADPITVSYGKPIPGEPTGRDNPDMLKMKPSHGHDQTIVNGVSRIGYMSGGKKARWVDEDMADTITGKAVDFISRAGDKPFFLYFCTHDVHVPRMPNARFVGKSGCGTRGDAMQELDDNVGTLLDTLDKRGLTKDTLVIFSSDNGPVLDDGYEDGAVRDRNGHDPAGQWRAGKYSMFEGGTRVPLIARWPGHIKPGVSTALFSQVDFIASFARLANRAIPDSGGQDSLNMLPALLGESPTGREWLVSHAGNLALREGPWKYLPPKLGTRDGLGPWQWVKTGPAGMLYNVETDPGETDNVIEKHPERARQMAARLDAVRNAPGSDANP